LLLSVSKLMISLGTLLKKLKELHPDWTFIDEPVDTWTQLRNEKGNLLEVLSSLLSLSLSLLLTSPYHRISIKINLAGLTPFKTVLSSAVISSSNRPFNLIKHCTQGDIFTSPRDVSARTIMSSQRCFMTIRSCSLTSLNSTHDGCNTFNRPPHRSLASSMWTPTQRFVWRESN
jgi:hypothetical protein